jgi:peroxiredoxin
MTNRTLDRRATPLPPGTAAPEFELPATPDQTLSLADFRVSR